MKNIPKFEVKDKLKPLPNKNSNYYNLKYLEEVEVINNDLHPAHSKKLIIVKIIKGHVSGTHHNFESKYSEDIIHVFEDAFEKIYDISEDYSIF